MSNLDNQTPLGTEVLKISDDTNQTSKMCSNILPTIIDILTVHDLDPQVIKQQKNIIDSLDAYTFFAGDR
jgi:hypothetical protein